VVSLIVDGKPNSAAVADVHDGAISEAYFAGDSLVQLGEHGVVAGHMV
jgi:hypothetical protein